MRTLGREFLKLWVGQAVSEIGSVVTRTALPIAAVLVLHAGALELGFLVVCGSVAVVAVGLASGAWVDRLPRRPVMISADLGRALVLATIPFAALADVLRLELLYAVAFTSAALGAFFDAAYRAYPPALVPRERLVEANSALGGASAVAELAGPTLAGALVQFLTAPIALALDAASFLVSAVSLGLIRAPEPAARPVADRTPLVREIRAGLAFLARERSLRLIAASDVVGLFFGNFFASLYVLYALETLELSPFALGVVISAGGIGVLAATGIATPLIRRYGIGPTIVVAEIAASLTSLLVPLAAGPAAALFLLVPQVVGDGLSNVSGIGALTLRQLVVPGRMLGRVNATLNVLQKGIAPLGAVAGALLAEAFGIRAAVWIAVLGGILGALVLLLPSPLLRARDEGEVSSV